VVVDTTETAELDVLLQGISAESFDQIGRALKALPQSNIDRSIGNFFFDSGNPRL
jgi:hypothetical protein